MLRFVWKKGVWVSDKQRSEIPKGVRSKKSIVRSVFQASICWSSLFIRARFCLWLRIACRAPVWAHGYARFQCGSSALGILIWLMSMKLANRSVRCRCNIRLGTVWLDHRSLIYDNTPTVFSGSDIWVYTKRRNHVLR